MPARMIRCLLPALIAIALGGCGRRGDVGPVVVSVIGKAPALADTARGPVPLPSRVLLDSVAQGLVRLDASGQIAPGLAERWTVLDDGKSYVLRLREAEWSDGQPVTAAEVVTILRHQIARGSRNPLAPFLTAIDEIVEMTPRVIEIRLSRPRPDLLKLLAQPELAVLHMQPLAGSGPFRLASRHKDWVMLRPAFDPARAAAEDVQEPGPEESVQLYGERAARAIVRFAARQSDMVTGGSFVDWPLLAGAQIAPANQRIEVPAGLFGFAIVSRDGFLADALNRQAIAQALDHDAITAAFAPGWSADARILPEQLDSAAPPAAPAWAKLSAVDRRKGAQARVARWRADHPGALALRIALPKGPGANILFGFVGAGLRSVGVGVVRVPITASADLRLIDGIAPYDSARWYLAIACQLCGTDVRAKIIAARDAHDLSSRARALAEADAALAEDNAYIPIARPLRWNLVALRLARWQANPRGWHALNDLRNPSPQ